MALAKVNIPDKKQKPGILSRVNQALSLATTAGSIAGGVANLGTPKEPQPFFEKFVLGKKK